MCKESVFIQVCESMKYLEEMHPLPAHPSYFDEWAEDILGFWDSMIDCVCPSELYTILSLRKQLFELSLQGTSEHVDSNGWQWLLTVEQMPQRTADWYTQKINMVTASEISGLWKGPRARINLIASKCTPVEPREKRLATPRSETSPMDWGVRYEPVVKMILERDGSQIQELGRIQHRTINGLAASPDGLYTSGPLKGSLVEIKCPISRAIQSEIPFDYWCQMQIQMEVCGIDSCEYVEAKFKEIEDDGVDSPEGYISLLLQTDNDSYEMKYVYHNDPDYKSDMSEPWLCVETYSWCCTYIRRTIVKRDTVWFEKMRPDIELFWKEVADVREGRRVLEPAKRRVVADQVLGYSFVDSD
jgi:putative phage-type endonuclease